jgi:hypothetical protein
MRVMIRGLWVTVVALVASVLTGGAAEAHAAEIRVLSNRADLISGGDALVEVVARHPRVRLNGEDVTDRFTERRPGRWVGLVDGLRTGRNTLSTRSARITITNHPIGGPVFAGPQVQPWICGTVAAGLGEPIDAQCNAPTRYSFVYRNALTGAFLPYDPASPPAPALIARTTTDQGRTVPYVVRIEKGTMDRGIYQVAVLHQAWNHKLFAWFEGGGAGHHTQDPPPSVLNHTALSRGFMVGSSGLFVHASNINQVVSAEALMMLKERITEQYGEIRYTIGGGCSGGSIQQHVIASAYPGLLDGIQPTCSYPDLWTTATEVADCHLLINYFTRTSPQLWPNPAQRTAVDGHAVPANCQAWEATFSGVADPSRAANCNLPPSRVYPNPGGVRCSAQDYQKAIWGPRKQDGFAKRPGDNVGVQYGLRPLLAGQITPAQFADLNARIGGKDIDWRFQPGRTTADPGAAAIAYRSSQVTDARQLASVPIIDLRPHIEVEIHTSYHSYQLRAKLDRDNGGHGNQIIWTFPFSDLAGGPVPEKSFLLMDQWLAAIESDRGAGSKAAKVIRNKPGAAVDACWILGVKTTDAARCRAAYPYYADARIVAGAPFAGDIVKCRLKPLRRADYPVAFTDAEWTLVRQAFPTGVCDWTRRGVGQRPSTPWLTYAHGPGGHPLR